MAAGPASVSTPVAGSATRDVPLESVSVTPLAPSSGSPQAAVAVAATSASSSEVGEGEKEKEEAGGSTSSENDGGDVEMKAAALPVYSRLDETDLAEARALGLLRVDMEVNNDASMSDYGIAYEKKGGTRDTGCGMDVFATQKSLQERCKQFAMSRGFQLIVSGSSTRPNGGGNVKYRCKKLHGQQFFDPNTPASELQCPFYINGYAKGPAWKITRACFLHNHYKFIGWRPAAVNAHSSTAQVSPLGDNIDDNGETGAKPEALTPAVRPRTQRNTTLSTKSLCQMVTEEVNKFPSPEMVMAKLDGKMIKRILLTRGHTVNHMMASRIKRQLLDMRMEKVRSSFQKLASYLKLVAEKNPGSLFQVETNEHGVFKRALFIPSTTLHAFKHSRKLISLDHITPSWHEVDTSLGKIEDNENDDAICGVYLKAMSKDFNDQVVTFALALVVEEDQSNWEWFLNALQMATAIKSADYTVVAGRSRGLQQALQSVWPHASHHFCMRRMVEEELVLEKKIPLTQEKKQRIYELARSESESEFNSLRTELLRTNEATILFLDSVNKANWVKYAFLEAFRKPTYNEITCDLSMSLGIEDLFTVSPTHTSWFGEKPVRSSHPMLTFNLYFMKLTENLHHRRQSVELRSPQDLVPMRSAQLELILQGSQRCESIPCANGAYMVRSLGQTRPQIYDTWRHVNLLDWECTCQEWQDRLFPCVHGIHAAELDRRRIDSLYDIKENSVEYYKAGYSVSFTPWPMDASHLEVDTNLKTPLDHMYADDNSSSAGRRKPGPRPKPKKEKEKEI